MTTSNGSSPDYEVKAALDNKGGFDIVGVTTVTTNKDDKATDDINTLWKRFFEENVGMVLPQKKNDVIIAVYSDYEGDHEAPYRLTIGYQVKSTENLPKTLHMVHVEKADYAILSAAGNQPQALIETWKAVWESDLDRTYKTDFEVYGPRFFEDGVNEVLVHIGVKT